ncbi:hypothetical protein JCM3774_004688 [Rhodotorula dairenensis]
MLLPVILILAILAACALAYYFYIRKTATPSAPGSQDPLSTSDSVSTDPIETPTAATEATETSTPANESSLSGDRTSESASEPSRSATSGASKSSSSGEQTSVQSKTSDTSTGASAKPTTISATSSNSQVTASPTKVSNSGKKGAGYNTPEFTEQLGLEWAYNWASAPGGKLGDGVMYVPQLWGKKTDLWEKEATAAIKAGSTHILGPNEPDLAEQANMSPLEAALVWKAEIERFSGSAKLVSPGVTNGVKTADGKKMGVPWLLDFVAACTDCTIDAYALHWYDAAGNTDYFTSYLTEAYSKLKKPIWLTEFMGTGTPAEQKKFLEFAVPWLEKQTFIERYAVFGAFADNPIASFFNKDGTLTELGKTYASL